MARGRGGNPRHSSYERRILRRTGMLPDQARARGISLAAARGHAPRRLTPEGPTFKEHVLRDIRRRARGEPTEAERRFLRKQIATGRIEEDYDELVDIFMGYEEWRRDLIRVRQAAAERFYRASRGVWRWDTDRPRDWGSFPNPAPSGYRAIMYYH